ncbi:MAG: hypothetical protein ACJ8LN_15320, partial [Sulfurifustis sp.]
MLTLMVKVGPNVRRYSPLLLRLAIAVAIGIAFPYLELVWTCREGFQAMEACVWGKAYLPISRWVEPIIVAPIAFLLLSILPGLRTRNRRERIQE